jgi:YidC/Oxa1 family membrane protein insertase
MTPSARPVTGAQPGAAGARSPARRWIVPLLLGVLVLLFVAGCAAVGPSPSPGASGAPSPSPTPIVPLVPAQPSADPIGFFAWIFTPLFQALFILLAFFYKVVGDIGIAIVLLTIVIRALLVPLYRQQLVSQRRMQLLQPELKEMSRRYKGDRQRQMAAQQELYRERGVNPLSGCLPLLLQMPLLYIMYQVIRDGLTNFNVNPMLHVFGVQLFSLNCSDAPQFLDAAHQHVKPCIDTIVPWLLGINAGQPHLDIVVMGVGTSILAIVSALLQIVQSKMTLPATDPRNDDPSTRTQRQMLILLPVIFVVFAGALPAGLYIYYIVSTIFGIAQQYLIIGWGSMFPLFGWTPGFVQNHTPRFPVAYPAPTNTTRPAGAPAPTTPEDRAAAAARTVRPRERGRQGRRGRRR